MKKVIILALAMLIAITGCAQMQFPYETQRSTDEQFESTVTETKMTVVSVTEDTMLSIVENSMTDDDAVTPEATSETVQEQPYRDGTASVCVVDEHVLDQLAVTFDFL